MTVKEVLEACGSDSDTVLARFGNNEALLERFIVKLPQDQNFSLLKEAIEHSDYSSIETSAHTLKGVAANLGFTVLSGKSDVIVKAVRAGQTDGFEDLFAQLQEEYESVIENIGKLG